ncbi:MAG TPA: phosphoribulokinase [Azoarcus taiwanensis]|uniref:Phosphoribulokinase n=1 Tax=Azoarcus taiwanensis TaxID=666964 RepID=A0A972FCH0_9RHOO|nr:phosphoribulokinase [Azoarcus taiwanensis]NMG02100.1 phosphoribulokinase [Azoarcus taiwanensis]HRQ58154.1 phosphoribulokinase [Azoarcus taiwanensis]
MSSKHPIIAVTGSSGAGTTTVKHTFEAIFHRENVNAAIVEGDSFHRYTRDEMRQLIDEAEARGERGISHFGPEANLLEELEALFRGYGESAVGRKRFYIHNEEQAMRWNLPMGTFTKWEDLPVGTDCLFYEGLHGGFVTDTIDVARHVDLLIGVAPTINLEWIQKLHRDTRVRGYSMEAVQDTILRRMHDYVHCIVPQFSRTHINFQRVPVVDTSNPFIARDVPSLAESMVVIRFRDPRGIDFPYLINMISDAFMSRANSIVIPGGKLDLAMQLILTPLIWKLMEKRRKLV